MQVLCKAVGKYKDKFNQTGLLLVVDGQDRWCDFPGQLGWKQYKDKIVDVDMSQNEKGYWHGAFVGQQASQEQPPNYQPADQGYTPPPQAAPAYVPPPRDTGVSIERQASFKAACHRFQGMSEATNTEIMTLAALGADFCITGKANCGGQGGEHFPE